MQASRAVRSKTPMKMSINHRSSYGSVHLRILKRRTTIITLCIIFFSLSLIFRVLDAYNTLEIGDEEKSALFPRKSVLFPRYSEDWKVKNSKTLASEEFYRLADQSSRMKYILLWTPKDQPPFNYFYAGQKCFIDNKCSRTNCFVTADSDLFNGDLTKFDAIAFNGRNLDNIELPKLRTARQKYIYFNSESSDNFPVCNAKYDNFFNWTATFRLDSDIVSPFIEIRNQSDEVIGPKPEIQWPDSIHRDEKFDNRRNKTKAVAWFASACKTRSHRETIASMLRTALLAYGQTVDIYGKCGSLMSPANYQLRDDLLKNDYFFYLSFENSLAEDYVTEELLIALNNDVVPIVLGGADYSRFLPPGSYLDATELSIRRLASTIVSAISSPSKYNEFFRWKSYKYRYSDPSRTSNVCAVCAALSNKTFYNTTSYYIDFRRWWHPGYKERCSE